MSGLRIWIVALMGVSFLAGIPAGVLIVDGTRPQSDDRGAFTDFAHRLGDEFDLSDERRRALRVILADYDSTLDGIRSRQLDRYEDEIVRAGRLCRDRIRNVLLPEDQRDRFDVMAAPFLD